MNGEIIEVEVTQDDIDQGTCGSLHNCPVAIATSRTTGLPCCASNGSADTFLWVWVPKAMPMLMENEAIPEIRIDGEESMLKARKFITAFDKHEHVSPIKFRIKMYKK